MTQMRYRQLGSSGLVVSLIGLGCNAFGRRVGETRTHEVVRAALDAGVTLFDTADSYGQPRGSSEELLGEALAATGQRDSVVLATKFGNNVDGLNGPDWGVRGSRRYIRTAVEGSLRRLRTDRIDLYQMHYPDPYTPIEETLAALDELITEGKVRYVGCSNFPAWQVADACWAARTAGHRSRFIGAQDHYNLLERGVEAELVPACERFGLGVIPYYPLASGLLTGKYHRDESLPEGSPLHRYPQWLTSENFDRIAGLSAYAEKRDIS